MTINKDNRAIYIVAGVLLLIIIIGIIVYALEGTDKKREKNVIDISSKATIELTEKLDDIITVQTLLLDSLQAVREDINISNEKARRDIAIQTKRQRDEINRIRNYNPALDVLIDDYNRAMSTKYPFD
jgi:hypothetical protein